jgi:hypothetical protein
VGQEHAPEEGHPLGDEAAQVDTLGRQFCHQVEGGGGIVGTDRLGHPVVGLGVGQAQGPAHPGEIDAAATQRRHLFQQAE